MIKLMPPSELRSDPSNPRETDVDRLELVKLSLRKFGFLLPLYAKEDLTILSGHQRVLAASTMGWQVPVLIVSGKVRDTAGLNLTFNRSTNDFDITDIDHNQLDIEALISKLESLPDCSDQYPCMSAQKMPVQDLVKANIGRFKRYAGNAARGLGSYRVQMPIVIDPAGKVVNGIGRLRYASERKQGQVDAVSIDNPDAVQLVDIVMNRLSMDFAFTPQFKDALRANAFRRKRQRRKSLGSGYLFALGAKKCKDFHLGRNKEKVKALYGARVLDFGAGHGDEAQRLRQIGISVTAFEPYRSFGGKPKREAGRYNASAFLRAVASGTSFDSIILSSVLNSVPFDQDRVNVVQLCAALAESKTTLYAAARGRHDPNWRECHAAVGLGKTASRSARFVLKDEPGMALSELNDAPKIQRFFQPSEFHALFCQFFQHVEIGTHINNVTAICRDPFEIDPILLRKAIEFEFDLPYPEGKMGFVEKAIEAFSKRLGVVL